MPEFEVEIHPGQDHLHEICHMYWETDDDGSFVHTVKAVAERFNQPSNRVTKIVAEACVARSASQRCSECDKRFVYRTRSDWTSRGRVTPRRCDTCTEAEKRRQDEEREQRNVAMRAAVLDAYEVDENGMAPAVESLGLCSAFALAALLEDAEEICGGVTFPTAKRVDPLTPTQDYDFELLNQLAEQGLVRLHPSSPLESFTWRDDDTLGNAYYPMQVSYYLPGVGSLRSRVESYLKQFGSIVRRENWPDTWIDQLPGFWLDLAVSECKAYLIFMLQRHRLAFTPGKKTDDVFRRALKWYSIGQVYYFIWRAARDSAAYQAREKVSAKRAANSAITRISVDVERAYAQGWQVSVYRRDSRLPVSTLSHLLFSRALRIDDPMAHSPVDLPIRRAGLELDWKKIDSETFERLIFQLVEETEGYENVEWLMHTNASDRGRDVSATRLRRDLLSGHSSQRVAIQCKHWRSQSVRAADIAECVTNIGLWQNPGFDVLVIATSGRFTADAVAWLEQHNSRGGRPTIEVWNDARLESLLHERPHLIRDYELR